MPERIFTISFKILCAFILVLIGIGVCDSRDQSTLLYTRHKSYKALRLTYSDLSKLLLGIQEILKAASKNTSSVYSNQISVENQSEKLTLKGNFESSAFTDAPNMATNVEYRFRASKHPIENVPITLRDYNREVEVVGTSLTHVQAISAIIHEHLQTKETIFGGWTFRTLVSGILIAFFLTNVPLSFYLASLYPRFQIHFSVMGLVCSLLFFYILIASPLRDDWLFPGIAIYKDTASVVTRFAPEFTFYGMFLTLISCTVLSIRYLYRKFTSSTQQNSSSDAD